MRRFLENRIVYLFLAPNKFINSLNNKPDISGACIILFFTSLQYVIQIALINDSKIYSFFGFVGILISALITSFFYVAIKATHTLSGILLLRLFKVNINYLTLFTIHCYLMLLEYPVIWIDKLSKTVDLRLLPNVIQQYMPKCSNYLLMDITPFSVWIFAIEIFAIKKLSGLNYKISILVFALTKFIDYMIFCAPYKFFY